MYNQDKFLRAWLDRTNQQFMAMGSRRGRGLDPDERLECKLKGLETALRKFDPSRGIPFTHFLRKVVAVTSEGFARRKFARLRQSRLKFRGDLFYSEAVARVSLARWQRERRTEHVADALTSLSTDDRRLIERRFWERLRYREIAAAERCSESAAKRRVRSALDALRPYLRGV
jgi:RNA polymerase sigma factor (sigma-70 family)